MASLRGTSAFENYHSHSEKRCDGSGGNSNNDTNTQ